MGMYYCSSNLLWKDRLNEEANILKQVSVNKFIQ